MRNKWLLSLFAVTPYVVTMIVLQSCGGEGGPLGTSASSITKAFLALMSPAQQKATYIGAQKCANPACHGATDHAANYTSWLQTKHGQNNVSCERCHGPGSLHAANPAAGNILKLPQMQSAVICAQCHGPTYDAWNASKHAQLVADPVNSGKSCFMCHSGLVRTQYMENGIAISSLTNAQVTQVINDTLNVVPNTAGCVTCHDPHTLTGNLDAEGVDVQLYHQVTNNDTTVIGPETPSATYTNYNQVCGECHNGRGADGGDAKLTSSTSRPDMHEGPQMNMLLGIGGAELPTAPITRTTTHATIVGQCSHCHMGGANHSFVPNYDVSCQPCHTAADAAARVDALKTEIVDSLFALLTRMQNYAVAHALGGIDCWDYTSNIPSTETAPDQSLIPIELKRSRHNYYFVLIDNSKAVHNAAYARYLLSMANTNMDVIQPGGRPERVPQVDFNTKVRILNDSLARARQADLSGF